MTTVIEKEQVEIKEFDEEQTEKLKKIFDLFYPQSIKIQAIAKAVKLATIGENYVKKITMDDFEIEALMDSIVEINKVIQSECGELACNPNYLLVEDTND